MPLLPGQPLLLQQAAAADEPSLPAMPPAEGLHGSGFVQGLFRVGGKPQKKKKQNKKNKKKKMKFTNFGQPMPTRLITCANHGNDVIRS